ncbi:thiol-disulfide isomerase/thioredoxin [Pedobacter africanus]|uniref:Thiol-disulfide isomerase/thioredoxin n=1 Tax=Pedobacter africanus TaxID=151894 RepID=A0ACC6KSS6_9SPHI|nr:thioredoxin family protein [Pedobacter africanus]MDR6782198.1 thiol-disulfide isomerase/thioredoxin [Pedobacter africanus]
MKLKTLLFAFAAALTIQTAIAQSTPAPATEVLNAAIKKAAKEKKQVLAVFHASWCGWCHKMTASLNDPAIKPYFDKNYVIADFTVYESKGKENLENPGAADLLKKYNNADQGLPTWLVFDAKQNLVADSQMRPAGAALTAKGDNVGCPAKPEEVAHFIASLKKSSKLNDKELEDIAVVFRKNEIKR